MFTGLLIICGLVYWFTRTIVMRILEKLVARSKTMFDDILMEKQVFKTFSRVIPAILVEVYAPGIFSDFDWMVPGVIRITEAFIVYIVMRVLLAILNSFKIYSTHQPALKDKPIDSFVQLGKIGVWIIFGVWIVSILADKSPLVFFSAMGAVSAVLLLIFKDTILGFVASIQLSANDMVRVGDWVSLPKFGADGDVTEITLATIKVQNFDKTITTIPTYNFISDAFKNWRGMEESDGRRIKRTITIKISSLKFADEAMVGRFKKLQLIADFVSEKSTEIQQFNVENSIDKSVLVNGRHMTNIGVFRKYVELYLRNHPNINQNMTCMVRQLAPTATGLPIEIYAFISNKEWIIWEGIVADIFDHVLASVSEFDLEVFENPTGVLGPAVR